MLRNIAKFQNFQLDNLVDFEKCCKTRIFLQKSVPMQPKTSNILPKFCQKLAAEGQPEDTRRVTISGPSEEAVRSVVSAGPATPSRPTSAIRSPTHSQNSGKICKILAGSFSVVSKPNLATQFSFYSIFQDPQDLHIFAPLQIQHFSKNRDKESAIFVKF